MRDVTKPRFAVCFEIITSKSAERGEFDSLGHVGDFITLRDALEKFDRWHVTEPSSSVVDLHTWVSCSYREDYRTGEEETRTLHAIQGRVTLASWKRIVRWLCRPKEFRT